MYLVFSLGFISCVLYLLHMEPLNAIILRFTDDSAHAAIEQVMEKIPFKFCASVGAICHHYSNVSDENQVWFNSSDMRGGFYEGVDHSGLLALDEDLVEQMRECEAVFMNMVTRLEYARKISYEERKRMYYLHLRFWNDFLEKHEINLFLSGIMPHEIPDFVIYSLCKLKGIHALIFHASTVRDCAFLEEDWEESAVQTRDRYQELLSQARGKDIFLSRKFEEYYQKLTKPAGKKPIDFKRPTVLDRIVASVKSNTLRSFVAFIRWIPTLLSPRAWYRRFQKMHAEWYRFTLRRYYDQHVIEPDFSQKYIYFPLHFQPECSTCPMAGAFVDQQVAIQLLSYYAPEGVLLYVKEHPRQRKKGVACRSIDFYRRLVSMPNVRLIKYDVSSFTLREHSSAVATGTGTAGFEAIFRQKPLFMFGHRYYQYAPGVFPIRTREDCQKAMEAIFERGEKPDLLQIRTFLKAMEETCVPASVNEWHRSQASETSFEGNTQAIASALLERIRLRI